MLKHLFVTSLSLQQSHQSVGGRTLATIMDDPSITDDPTIEKVQGW